MIYWTLHNEFCDELEAIFSTKHPSNMFSFLDNRWIHWMVVGYENKHFLFLLKNLRYQNESVDFYGLWYESKHSLQSKREMWWSMRCTDASWIHIKLCIFAWVYTMFAIKFLSQMAILQSYLTSVFLSQSFQSIYCLPFTPTICLSQAHRD